MTSRRTHARRKVSPASYDPHRFQHHRERDFTNGSSEEKPTVLTKIDNWVDEAGGTNLNRFQKIIVDPLHRVGSVRSHRHTKFDHEFQPTSIH
jgi:hypothetical protein